MGQRNSYTEEQEILIIDLYTKTATSQIKDSNPEIIKLCNFFNANGFKCVVSGIRNKMENLKSVDPEYTSNGKIGRSNIRRGFKELWLKELNSGFCNLDSHVDHALSVIQNNQNTRPSTHITWPHRLGQEAFRERVLASFENTCCISGMHTPELIQACHIKPYKICKKEGRDDQLMDVRNGLCMNILYHKAFDEGLFTIDLDHTIILSSELDSLPLNDSFFRPYEGSHIITSPRTFIGEEYLEYHRKNVFQD